MRAELYTSAFCAPCAAARQTLDRARALVPALDAEEIDVAGQLDRAEAAGIRSTPTVIVRRADGTETFRAEGAPTLDRLLAALGTAL